MVRRSAVRLLANLLAYVVYVCDECGCGIDLASARVVSDDTGTFPVCCGCAGRFPTA